MSDKGDKIESTQENYQEVIVDASSRTNFLCRMFPKELIHPSEKNPDEVVVNGILETAQMGYPRRIWTLPLKKGDIEYSFQLSDPSPAESNPFQPVIKLIYTDEFGNKEERDIFTYVLNAKSLIRRGQDQVFFKDLNMGIFLGRRGGPDKQFGMIDLSRNIEFPLQELDYLEDRKFYEIVSRITRINRVRGFGFGFVEGDLEDILSLEISF